jgi:hypothetical protein
MNKNTDDCKTEENELSELELSFLVWIISILNFFYCSNEQLVVFAT